MQVTYTAPWQHDINDLTAFEVTVEQRLATDVVTESDELWDGELLLDRQAVDGSDERLTQLQLVDLLATQTIDGSYDNWQIRTLK